MLLSDSERRTLLDLARASILTGLRDGSPLAADHAGLPPALLEIRASFVTLELGGQLRGCIGALEPTRPLVDDVCLHAFEAAMEDPRFPSVTRDESARLEIHISVLSPMLPLPFTDEEDLLRQLRPGRDGLVITDGHRRATFLPAVWDDVPNPREFLEHLKRKAGFREHVLPAGIQAYRYETESFP